MSNFKRNQLIIGISCWIICLLTLWVWVVMEPDAEQYLDTSVYYSIGDMGFDPGIGAKIEPSIRYNDTELKAYGKLIDIHKQHHDAGYSYGYGGELRQFVYDDLFVGGGYGWAGYKTKNGETTWRKDGKSPFFSAGYAGQKGEVSLTYRPNDQTINHTESIGLLGKVMIYKDLWVFAKPYWCKFEQRGRTLHRQTTDIGMTYRFK